MKADRIKIAEFCGWRHKIVPRQTVRGEDVHVWEHPLGSYQVFYDELPDFINDHSAIIKAVKQIPLQLRTRMLEELNNLGVQHSWEFLTCEPQTISAALLKTIENL